MKKIMMIVLAIIAVAGLTVFYNKETAVEVSQSTESATLPASEAPIQEEKEIIVGMSGGYKPYTFMDENNKLRGFEVDIWNEIGKRIDRDVAFKTADFSGLFGLLDTGKITTIANQITVNEKRLEKYDFSDPYVFYGAQLVVRADDADIVDLETLKGKRVGVSLGSNYEEMVKTFDVNDEIEVVTYESYQASLQDVTLGRIDAVLNDKLAAVIAIEESGLDLKLGGKPVEEMHNAFPFVKSDENTELIQSVSLALEAMHEDGTLSDISQKWFSVDITEE